MSNPIDEIFFISKALAEIVGEKFEDNMTNLLSDLGKFDAETRQRLLEENIAQFELKTEVETINIYESTSKQKNLSIPKVFSVQTITSK